MADYDNKDRRVYAFAKDLKVGAGARVDGDSISSLLEADAKAGVNYSIYGVGAGAEADAHVFEFTDKNSNTAARALGIGVKANAGLDLEAFVKKGHIAGAELEAKATMVECKAGPIGLHLGIGVSTKAKVEDGTLDARLAGVGLKVGKRVGLAVFDNEFSLETLSLVGKGWLWGQFD